jgi:hypothetical protein
MEGKDGKPKEEAEGCLKDNGLDYAKVMTCANSDEGEKLALAAAQVSLRCMHLHMHVAVCAVMYATSVPCLRSYAQA